MKIVSLGLVLVVFSACFSAAAQPPDGVHQISPQDLVKQLSVKAPLILNVGPKTLYVQAHIRGAEYMGAGSSEEGRAKLSARVKTLPKNTSIVLYCGCCPWEHCPNVDPALDTLTKMGFTNVKVLYIAHNIGDDWVNKGYPVERGK
jgi:thiosulfate/3-mercaptopyruvate sulfurtransferase